MRREESSANPDKQPGQDDANANPGTGASGPGEPGYSGESGVNEAGGEAEIDLEEKRRAVEQDPGSQSGG